MLFVCLTVASAPCERVFTRVKLHELTISPNKNVSGRTDVAHMGNLDENVLVCRW